jgi:hypothetical protein
MDAKPLGVKMTWRQLHTLPICVRQRNADVTAGLQIFVMWFLVLKFGDVGPEVNMRMLCPFPFIKVKTANSRQCRATQVYAYTDSLYGNMALTKCE